MARDVAALVSHVSHAYVFSIYRCVTTLESHQNSPVVNLHLRRDYSNELIVSHRNGVVRLWDIAQRRPTRTLPPLFPSSATSLHQSAVHAFSPILACASAEHGVRVVTMYGQSLSNFRPSEGLFGQRSNRVSCIAFHPYKLLLAVGTLTGTIVVLAESNRTSDEKSKKK
jgi:WD40 repeat protein